MHNKTHSALIRPKEQYRYIVQNYYSVAIISRFHYNKLILTFQLLCQYKKQMEIAIKLMLKMFKQLFSMRSLSNYYRLDMVRVIAGDQ